MNLQKEYLSAEEAAAYLGISLRTLYSYVSREMITVYKPTRKLYFSRKEICGYIKSGKQGRKGKKQKTVLLRNKR
jgi:excisionase family DNA binding protein